MRGLNAVHMRAVLPGPWSPHPHAGGGGAEGQRTAIFLAIFPNFTVSQFFLAICGNFTAIAFCMSSCGWCPVCPLYKSAAP